MMLKNWVRSKTPLFILNWNRKRKKRKQNSVLETQSKTGQSFTEAFLIEELKGVGIIEGDTLLIHSSLSKIGHLIEGPKTIVNALIQAVGPNGHLLMPTSPNNSFQLDYIRNTQVFDVLNSKSKTGAITEYFRKFPNTKRSLHPTEPVSVLGPNSEYYISNHLNSLTPYQPDSPFAKVAEQNGKILYIGVTLDNAGTSLHTLEDAIVDFKYPIYYPDTFEIDVKDEKGEIHTVTTKVHNPKYSALRQCDKLIPHFEKAGVLKHVKIGNAKALLVDAKGFFNTMVKLYHEKGVTMYTPNGENLKVD